MNRDEAIKEITHSFESILDDIENDVGNIKSDVESIISGLKNDNERNMDDIICDMECVFDKLNKLCIDLW